MKLRTIRIRLFRSVVDSTKVEIEPDVTCLVGKNEAGKTAVLQALWYLKPATPFAVKVTRDYPRWRKVRDARETDLGAVRLVEAVFELEQADLNAAASQFTAPLPPGSKIRASRTYGGKVYVSIEMPEMPWVESLVEAASIDGQTAADARKCVDLESLAVFAGKAHGALDKRKKEAKALAQLRTETTKAINVLKGGMSDEARNLLWKRTPSFFYFSEYSSLRGRIDVTDLLSRAEDDLKDHERTALALLRLAGVEGGELTNQEFEDRIAELQAAAGEISNQVFEYWTQNPDIRVELVGDSRIVTVPPGDERVEHRYVDIRLWDDRHHMSTNFQTRSTGFQWFFSFIAAFSAFEDDENLVILLDEPGLGLHARAQHDLLRYIDERLGKTGQVVYTAHSPFMVNPKKLKRVRLAEDLSTRDKPDIGAKISTDVFSVRSDTLFPLQAALGYDLAQNLFVGGFNLVVEGPSDLLYLTSLSHYLDQQGRDHLDERWVQVPVGGFDKIPTFVALLGAHVDVTVLTDSRTTPNQRLQDMIAKGLLDVQRLVGVGQAIGKSDADIEDLFLVKEYLDLYNACYGASLKASDLQGSDGIVKQLERTTGGRFDHLGPATEMLGRGEQFMSSLDDMTLDRFEELFRLINATLPQT